MTSNYLRQCARRADVALERVRLRIAPAPHSLNPDLALADLPETPRVLFLCRRNLCLSPLAERYARKCDEAGAARFDSAGFSGPEGRTSSTRAVDVVSHYGVDLTAHRSRRVTEAMLDESALVVVMDAYDYRDLRREFGARSGVLLLSAFDGGRPVEIDDPRGGGWRAFKTACERVTDAVRNLVEALGGCRAASPALSVGHGWSDGRGCRSSTE